MNCCNEYGDCTQGRDCPTRTGKVLPHQAAHARRVAPFKGQPKVIEVSTARNHTEHPAVARIKSTRPVWMDGKGTPVPPEAGNFQIEYLGPDEGVEFRRTLLLWLAGAVVAVTVVGVAVGYGTENFSAALWTLLQGVS